MKRILFFSHAMELGGAERALLGLLENIDDKAYQVDLFLMRHSGELLSYLPGKVRLLPEIPRYTCLATPIGAVLKKKQFSMAWGRVCGKCLAKYRVKKLHLSEENGVELEYSHKYTLPFVPKVGDGIYDLAISFLTPHYFVANKVSAKKKMAWIHTDYRKVKVDVESEQKMWERYDFIASISEDVTQGFLEVFPSLKTKIRLIPNMMPIKCIGRQVEAFSVNGEMPEDGSTRLLSIGRFCTAKNFDNVPEICSRILSIGLNVKWYLIGYGGGEGLIRRKIEEFHMQEYVIILGKKENPYPYIKACDLYVQPSRYEGNSVTVHEAQILGKPVVITRYATSSSQLEDGVDGVVVPMDNEGCARGIVDVLENKTLLKLLRYNIGMRDYGGQGEIKKVYELVGEEYDINHCTGI